MERINALRQRWKNSQLTKAQATGLGIGCIIATLIVGFGFAGWVTGGSAQKMVAEAATNARQELATAVCVEEFMASEGAKATLVKLKDAAWYDRGEALAKGGWATMPDRKEPSTVVAAMCATQLSEMQIPAAGLTPASAAAK